MLAAVIAVRHVANAAASPLDPGGVRGILWTGGLVLAFACYLVGLALLRKRSAALWAVIAIAAAIQLAPLLGPLLLSRDAYVYWNYGRTAAVHGGNPYRDLPSRWPTDPAYARMGADWHRTYDAYGPLWTLASEGQAKASGSSPRRAAAYSKALGAAGALALITAAAFAARRRAFAAAIVGWNPLFALHLAGGGHNDGWMLAAVLAALGFAARGRRWASGAAWVVGITVKWLPLLYLPLIIARDRRRFPWLGLAAGAVVAAAISTARYGPWWLKAVAPVTNQLRATGTYSIPHWISLLGPSPRTAAVILTIAFAIVYLWLLREAWRGRARLGLAGGLFLLTLTWLVPWYATWALAPAAVEEDDAALVLGLALSAYLLRDALPR